MGKYKVIFVNIDDTLKPMYEKNLKNIINKVKEKDVFMVLTTNNDMSYAIKKSIEDGLSEYVIASNGSEVYNYKTKEIIFERNIPEKVVKKVYEYCNNLGITMIFNSFTKRFINVENYNDDTVSYFNNIDELLKENKINQIEVISKNFERMMILPNLFEDKFPELKVVHSSSNLKENNKDKDKEYCHDIVLKNTSKSTGIVELLDYFDIDSNEAIAIGSEYDDIRMFDVVGYSVTFDNADNILKENADYIINNNENDFSKALEKLILKS